MELAIKSLLCPGEELAVSAAVAIRDPPAAFGEHGAQRRHLLRPIAGGVENRPVNLPSAISTRVATTPAIPCAAAHGEIQLSIDAETRITRSPASWCRRIRSSADGRTMPGIMRPANSTQRRSNSRALTPVSRAANNDSFVS